MVIIGHRGAKGYEPENTLASFQKAIALGVDMIELDVYTTKTGEAIVIHDPTVDRTTNGTGSVADLTFDELRKLDAGNGETVPLLTEVLDLIDRRMPVNIEMKAPGCSKAVAKIIRQYVNRRGWRHDLFLISSFNHEELRDFARLSPQTPIATLFKHVPASYWKVAPGSTVISTNVDADHVTRKNVRDAHRHGVKLLAYTVNTKREASRMSKLFVDGIFSDYPDRVASFNTRSTAASRAARRGSLRSSAGRVSPSHR